MKDVRRKAWRGALLIVLAVAGFMTAGIGTGVGLAHETTQTTPTKPPGGEGCTPGFWKNHPEDWVGYSPTATLTSVFGAGGLGSLGSTTLLDALSFKGGSTLEEAKQILLRHAVAALLNAAHPDVDYDMTTAEVIALVQTALASGDREDILAAKDTLAGLNEEGCPL
jgi:hypothetical protein